MIAQVVPYRLPNNWRENRGPRYKIRHANDRPRYVVRCRLCGKYLAGRSLFRSGKLIVRPHGGGCPGDGGDDVELFVRLQIVT